MGGRLTKCSAESFHKQVDALPEERRPILAPVMKQLLELTAHIRGYDKAIEEQLATYPEGEVLRQVAGVGPQVALAFICTVEDPHRFKSVRKIGSYLGLRPRIDQSGEVNKQLRITKAGDSDLRRLLVNSAQYILGPHGPECDLRRWGLGLVDRGGTAPKKKAVIAVARKLAVLLLSLWKTGGVYDPSRHKKEVDRVPVASVAEPAEVNSHVVPETITSAPAPEATGKHTGCGRVRKAPAKTTVPPVVANVVVVDATTGKTNTRSRKNQVCDAARRAPATKAVVAVPTP
jgi:hypothetical protein